MIIKAAFLASIFLLPLSGICQEAEMQTKENNAAHAFGERDFRSS